MKAIVLTEAGGELAPAVVPEPVAGAGQLLVEVQAAGVNFSDLLFQQGVYPITAPTVPGYDVAGAVRTVGPGVSGFEVDDRVVAPLFAPGAFAEFALVDAALAVRLPERVEPSAAVALPVQGLTALTALRDTAGLAAGESVLVTAAAGGVGHLAVQLARVLGARRVVGAAGDGSKRDLVRTLGADDAVAPGDRDVTGFDVVVDSVGGGVGRWAAGTLAPGGRIVVTAARTPDIAATLEGMQAADDAQRAGLAPGGELRRVPYLGLRAPVELREDLAELVVLVAAGRLRVVVRDRYPLAEAGAALAALAGRRTVGKVVLEP